MTHTDCTHPATKAGRAACRKAKAKREELGLDTEPRIDTEARDLLAVLNEGATELDRWVNYAARAFCDMTEGTATEKARAILDYFAPSGDDQADARRRANGYTITTDPRTIRSIILRRAS